MIDRQVIKEVLDLALARGGDFADIFVEERKTTGIVGEERKIEKVHTGVDIGAGIRVLSDDSTAYAYTNDLSRKGLLGAANIVSHAVQGSKRNDLNLDLRKLKPTVDFTCKERPDSVTTDRKVSLVEEADKAARDISKTHIKQVIISYGDMTQKYIIANSNGELVEDERIRTVFVVKAVAASGVNMQTGYESVGNICGFELFEQFSPVQIAAMAANRAVALLGARPAPAGKMPVVLAGEAGGTMIHEACGHGLEADLVQKGLSVYAGKIGQKVASDEISVVDDATIDRRYGSYSFDDEGVPSSKVSLIENGVLKDLLYDRLTAAREARMSNGHGRRESYQHKPVPRMGNTYILPGKTNPETIIKNVRKGLLVKKMGGGQVNTTTGDFVFDVAEGYLIEEGEVGSLVRGATLTGNGPEVLREVEMVGSDLFFTIGTCGKEGQAVPVSDAQPTMSIKELIVGGTVQSSPNARIIRM